jgi:hypothetical protein
MAADLVRVQRGAFSACAEFLPLRNRSLGPLAMTVLPIPLARRSAATPCAAVQSTAALLSLVTGRASRSWSALRIDGLSRHALTKSSALVDVRFALITGGKADIPKGRVGVRPWGRTV